MDNEITGKESALKLGSDESVIASIPKEAFKAMFYLFAGKPDSKVKMFNRRVYISPDDLQDLNNKITDKLKLHQIDQSISTAVIKFNKKNSVEFGTWSELMSYDFKIPDITQEISLRWDFLMKLSSYAIAQRHTLTVRLSTRPTPKDIFQIIINQDPDDDSEIETKLGLCMVRVDFISHRLADELIDVVGEWNNSLRQPQSTCNLFCKMERWNNCIAHCVNYSIPLFVTLLLLVVVGRLVPDENTMLLSKDLLMLFRWLLLSILILYFSSQISRALASRCFRNLSEYGAFVPFLMTRGDENRIQTIDYKNKKKVRSFLYNAGFALFLNIVAGYICFKLWP